MFFETDAIVLKSTKSLNNDIFLTLLTKKAGKIDVVSNGAKSSKSHLAAASKPFVFGTFTLNTHSKIIKVVSCEIIDSHFRIADKLENLAYGNYFLELCQLTSTPNVPDQEHYQLIVEMISCLSKANSNDENIDYELLRLAYLIKLSKLTGHAPNLVNPCIKCGASIPHPFFSIGDGGLICEKCSISSPNTIKLNQNSINLIEYLMKKDIRIIMKTKIHENYTKLLLSIFDPYIQHHNSIYEIKSKKFLDEL